MAKPSPYSKAAVAEKLAQNGANEPPVLPPVRSVPMIARIVFADHGRTGVAAKPIREVNSAQALLSEDERDRGVWVDGKILVPWANVRWVEYR
jgi:hypothetical protein